MDVDKLETVDPTHSLIQFVMFWPPSTLTYDVLIQTCLLHVSCCSCNTQWRDQWREEGVDRRNQEGRQNWGWNVINWISYEQEMTRQMFTQLGGHSRDLNTRHISRNPQLGAVEKLLGALTLPSPSPPTHFFPLPSPFPLSLPWSRTR